MSTSGSHEQDRMRHRASLFSLLGLQGSRRREGGGSSAWIRSGLFFHSSSSSSSAPPLSLAHIRLLVLALFLMACVGGLLAHFAMNQHGMEGSMESVGPLSLLKVSQGDGGGWGRDRREEEKREGLMMEGEKGRGKDEKKDGESGGEMMMMMGKQQQDDGEDMIASTEEDEGGVIIREEEQAKDGEEEVSREMCQVMYGDKRRYFEPEEERNPVLLYTSKGM